MIIPIGHEDGTVRRLAYDKSRFEYGRVNVPANLGDVGFSGFRLLTAFGNGSPHSRQKAAPVRRGAPQLGHVAWAVGAEGVAAA